MGAFEGLVNKIQSVNWEFEIKKSRISDVNRVIFNVPKEREREELSISEVNSDIHEVLESNFEKYRYIKGFEGIWSKDLNCIECEIEMHYPSSRFLQTLNKLFIEDKTNELTNDFDEIRDNEIGEELNSDSDIRKVTIYSLNNIEVDLGYCSKEFAIFSSLKSMTPLRRITDRKITIQINGIDINTHEESLQCLLKISNSLFFQLSNYLDFPIKLMNERRNRRDRVNSHLNGDDVQASLSNASLLKYEYDNEPMSLYIHGRNLSDLPLNQFLSFYQTIEYYFPMYSNMEAKQKIKRLLKDPLFDPNNETKLTKILSIVHANRNGEIGDERSQLKATVKHCIEVMDLTEFILDNEERKEYFEKNDSKKLSTCTINVKSKNNDIINEVCERIYDIRCKIVHKKANGYDGELILPYSSEIKYIKHDINLVEFVAQKILIDNSRPLELVR